MNFLCKQNLSKVPVEMKNVKTRRIYALMDHANAGSNLGLCATLTLSFRYAHWERVFALKSEGRLNSEMELPGAAAILLHTSAIPVENVRAALAMEIAMD